MGNLQLGNPVEIGIATVRLESGSVTARGRKERGGRDADSWVPHGSDKEERGPAISEKGEGGGTLLLGMGRGLLGCGGGASRPERGGVGSCPAEGGGGEGFGWGFSFFFFFLISFL